MGLINLDFRRFGWQYVFLNVVRVCNAIVLATIAIAAVLLIIAAKFPNPWIVFADIFLVFHVLFCIFLFLTEFWIGLWVSLEINMPAFGRESGLTGLGCAMMVLASSILGKLSDERFASDKIGPVFWNTCAAAGILGYIFGLTNALSSWLLGSRQGRNIRKFRSTGEVVPSPALPEHTQDTRTYYGGEKFSQYSDPTSRVQSPAPSYSGAGRGTLSRASSQHSQGQQHGVPHDDNIASLNGFNFGDGGRGYDEEVSIQSGNGKTSPIIPNLARPDSSLHPFYKGMPSHVSSRYSLVSHFKRFSGTSRRP